MEATYDHMVSGSLDVSTFGKFAATSLTIIDAIVTQAQGEFEQITPAFVARLHVLIGQAVTLLRETQNAANMMIDEYDSACGMWDAMTPQLQTAQRAIIVSYTNSFFLSSDNLNKHWQLIINECNMTNYVEGLRVRLNFPLPLNMMSFIDAVGRRQKTSSDYHLVVQNQKDIYRNPSQFNRQGNKILGRYYVPKAVIDRWAREVLPPASTMSNLGWASDVNALPTAPGLSWQSTNLGAGGMGSTKAYLQRDGHGNIFNRIVIKDTHPVSLRIQKARWNYSHQQALRSRCLCIVFALVQGILWFLRQSTQMD